MKQFKIGALVNIDYEQHGKPCWYMWNEVIRSTSEEITVRTDYSCSIVKVDAAGNVYVQNPETKEYRHTGSNAVIKG